MAADSFLLDQLQLSNTQLAFPVTEISAVSDGLDIVISNVGWHDIVLDEITVMGEYVFDRTACPDVIKPGRTGTITVTFQPEGTGFRHGQLVIAAGRSGTHVIQLRGTGGGAEQLDLRFEDIENQLPTKAAIADLLSSAAGKGSSMVGVFADMVLKQLLDMQMGERTADNVANAAKLPDGAVFQMGGLLYKRDVTKVGTASVTYDFAQDGIIPYGYRISPRHFGTTTNFVLGKGQNLIGDGVKAPEILNTVNLPIVKVSGPTSGTSGRHDFNRVQDIRFNHKGVNLTQPAVLFEHAAYSVMENVQVVTDPTDPAQYGVVWGEIGSTSPVKQAYGAAWRDGEVADFSLANIIFNTPGTGLLLDNVSSRRGISRFSSGNVSIRSGQYSKIELYRGAAGSDYQFAVRDQSVENVEYGDFWFRQYGTGIFRQGVAENVHYNGTVLAGTLFHLDNGRHWRVTVTGKDPRGTSDSGNTAISDGVGGFRPVGPNMSLGPLAQENIFYMDQETAKGPIAASAGGVRNVKAVTGLVGMGNVQYITTNPNVNVSLDHGISELPSFWRPFHNGVAWNFQVLTLPNGTATSFTPPRQRCLAIVLTGGETTTWGLVALNADPTAATATLLCGGGALAALNNTALDGTTTGANLFVTLSATTNGLYHVQNRKGAANQKITILLLGVGWL